MDRQVLVVEDDPSIRKLIRRYLEKLRLIVREAGTGRDALTALDQFDPSLVCLDLTLPETSGYEICERIRATPRLSQVPVLVMSARILPSDRALAEEVGANAYLVKPIRWTDFAATVTYLVEGRTDGQSDPAPIGSPRVLGRSAAA